jgi:hypothetical protein
MSRRYRSRRRRFMGRGPAGSRGRRRVRGVGGASVGRVRGRKRDRVRVGSAPAGRTGSGGRCRVRVGSRSQGRGRYRNGVRFGEQSSRSIR